MKPTLKIEKFILLFSDSLIYISFFFLYTKLNTKFFPTNSYISFFNFFFIVIYIVVLETFIKGIWQKWKTNLGHFSILEGGIESTSLSEMGGGKGKRGDRYSSFYKGERDCKKRGGREKRINK